MITKTLLSSMTEKESKLAYQQIKKKKDIQLLASNGIESGVFIDDTTLDPFNLFIGFASNQGKVCKGQYGKKCFLFPSGNSSDLTRIWIDCREQDDIKFHINSSGQYYELSNDNEEHDDKLLIVLLHCPDFIQFSLYDGSLPIQKISHLFTTSSQASEKIKTIAHSILNQQFPGLSQYLHQLEGEVYEDQ
ncbi:hypothetical protein NSQ90_03445 [Paenibacillus sp. FSL H7-0737]|uniref:hypothetical protein n=1 Tax=unclassified Paenibacillus TaxID=185978 RepID=UPI0004F8666A|nr:hypothetical protein [Paenibacillus sp. FSL H7-0737]AIQ22003.1 hypothetical protein H70737_03510 [Paenibacillus sp. FSL H7-0737]